MFLFLVWMVFEFLSAQILLFLFIWNYFLHLLLPVWLIACFLLHSLHKFHFVFFFLSFFFSPPFSRFNPRPSLSKYPESLSVEKTRFTIKDENGQVSLLDDRPALLISSTSWTGELHAQVLRQENRLWNSSVLQKLLFTMFPFPLVISKSIIFFFFRMLINFIMFWNAKKKNLKILAKLTMILIKYWSQNARKWRA